MTDERNDPQELRQRAADVGIQGYEEMPLDQLRTALDERHRGADPQQAEEVARHRVSE